MPIRIKIINKFFYIFTESYRLEQLKNIMNWTVECIKHSDIITIFDIRRLKLYSKV